MPRCGSCCRHVEHRRGEHRAALQQRRDQQLLGKLLVVLVEALFRSPSRAGRRLRSGRPGLGRDLELRGLVEVVLAFVFRTARRGEHRDQQRQARSDRTSRVRRNMRRILSEKVGGRTESRSAERRTRLLALLLPFGPHAATRESPIAAAIAKTAIVRTVPSLQRVWRISTHSSTLLSARRLCGYTLASCESPIG